MIKIQFGAGSLHIPGWVNHDSANECDITKRLPYEDESVDAVYTSMVCEHLTSQQVWSFLEEVYRILKPGGFTRHCIPDFIRCWQLKDPDWLETNKGVTNNDGTMAQQMKSIIFCHGHQSLWSSELFKAVLESIGFKDVTCHEAGHSNHEALKNIEQHHHSVGVRVALAESGCIEGVKRTFGDIADVIRALESRIKELELLLQHHCIAVPPS